MYPFDVKPGNPVRRYFRRDRRLASAVLLAPLLLVIGGLSALPKPGIAGEVLVLTTPANTADTVIGEVILRTAYRRLGIDVIIKKYPAERAIRLANQGVVDGEVVRIEGIAKTYPNLIQVRPAINYIAATVFTTSTVFLVDGWKSLRPYRIGIIRGIKFSEQNTQGMAVAAAGNYERLFLVLNGGRVDIAVSPYVNGLYHLKRLGIENVKALEPDVSRFDLFHYLHRKRADLIPRIEAMLDRMWKSGELAQIRMRVVEVMLDRANHKLDICDEDYACYGLENE